VEGALVLMRRRASDIKITREFEAIIRDLLDRDDAVVTINDKSATIYLNGPDEARGIIRALEAGAAARLKPRFDPRGSPETEQ
jgi:hypothetical protein